MTLTIKDIADVITISVSNPAESGYDVFVGLEHYDIGEPVITRFGSTKMLTTACKKFSAGDILLARRNVYLRRAGVVEFDGLTSGDSIVIRVKPNLSIEGVDSNAISRLLPFVLNTNAFWDFANTNSDGTMSKRLSPQMLLSYEFELPPVAEQKPLAEKLWAAYKLKASKLKLIEAIDEMVKSQFIEMQATSDQHNSLGDFIVRCTPERCGKRDLPILSVTKDNAMVFQNDRFNAIVVSKDRSNYIVVPRGYLVQGIHIDESNFGIQNLVNEGIVSPAYKLWRFKNENSIPELIEYYLRSSMAIGYFTKHFLGATVQRRQVIKKDDFLALPLNLPGIDKQKKFFNFYRQADKSKFELKKSIEKIDNVIKALMQ